MIALSRISSVMRTVSVFIKVLRVKSPVMFKCAAISLLPNKDFATIFEELNRTLLKFSINDMVKASHKTLIR